MVRPVDGSSPAATPSSVDDKMTFGEKFYAAAEKCGCCAFKALRVGAATAFNTTVKLTRDVKGFEMAAYGAVFIGTACIFLLALLASASALPVIAAVGSVIAAVTFGVGLFCLANIIVIPILVAGASIFRGGEAAIKVIDDFECR